MKRAVSEKLPLENASNTGATSDNDAESAVTVDSNSSDNNESEE